MPATPTPAPGRVGSVPPVAPAGARSLALPFAVAVFVSGCLGAAQSRANGQLAVVFGASVQAALWSFGSGWVVLTVALAHPAPRRALRTVAGAVRDGSLRWWQTAGGLIGGTFVAIQAYAVPRAGVALFLLGVVAGQTTGALLVDRAGLGPGGVTPVTRGRVCAAAVAVAGVALAVGGRVGAVGPAVVAPIVAAVGIGALMAVQTAINGRVNRVGGNVVATTWANFTWGVALLAVVAAGQAAAGVIGAPASWDAPWWAFLGGVLGIVFVGAGAMAVHHLGVLLVMLLMIAGQLLGALLLDVLSPATRHLVGPQLVAGVLVTMLAAGAAGVISGRAARARRAA